MLHKPSKLQRRAARVITGQTYDVRSTQILNSLDWTPVEDILRKRESVASFKALTGRFPFYLSSRVVHQVQ